MAPIGRTDELERRASRHSVVMAAWRVEYSPCPNPGPADSSGRLKQGKTTPAESRLALSFLGGCSEAPLCYPVEGAALSAPLGNWAATARRPPNHGSLRTASRLLRATDDPLNLFP